MAQNEFQKKYHDFQTDDPIYASREMERVNKEGIDNDKAVAIELPGLGYCLMLESAAKFLKQIKVLP